MITGRQLCRTYPLQIFCVTQPFPHVFCPIRHMSVTISTHSLRIKHIEWHILQNFHICSLFRLVAEHCEHLTAFTVIISLPVSAEGSTEHISVYIYRLLLPFRFGDMNNHDNTIVFFIYLHISIRQQIY